MPVGGLVSNIFLACDGLIDEILTNMSHEAFDEYVSPGAYAICTQIILAHIALRLVTNGTKRICHVCLDDLSAYGIFD